MWAMQQTALGNLKIPFPIVGDPTTGAAERKRQAQDGRQADFVEYILASDILLISRLRGHSRPILSSPHKTAAVFGFRNHVGLGAD